MSQKKVRKVLMPLYEFRCPIENHVVELIVPWGTSWVICSDHVPSRAVRIHDHDNFMFTFHTENTGAQKEYEHNNQKESL